MRTLGMGTKAAKSSYRPRLALFSARAIPFFLRVPSHRACMRPQAAPSRSLHAALWHGRPARDRPMRPPRQQFTPSHVSPMAAAHSARPANAPQTPPTRRPSMSSTARKPRIIVGITGASGSVYARSLLDELTRLDVETHLIVSPTSLIVMREEMDITFPRDRFDLAEFLGRDVPQGCVITHSDADLAAPPASGTFRARGMVVCPCSMKTLGALASGTGASLIARAADASQGAPPPRAGPPRDPAQPHPPAKHGHPHRGRSDRPARHAGLLPPPRHHRRASAPPRPQMLDALGVDHDIQLRWKDPDE